MSDKYSGNLNNIRILKTDEEIRVFSDPYRQRIIQVYNNERKPLTPKAVADILGEEPAKVAYHVKKLIKINILVLDHIESINGIQAKFYKSTNNYFEIDYQNSKMQKSEISDKTTSIWFNSIDEHKKIVKQYFSSLKKQENHNITKGIMLSRAQIYLQPEDIKQFEKELNKLIEKFSTKAEGKQTYDMIFSIIKDLNS